LAGFVGVMLMSSCEEEKITDPTAVVSSPEIVNLSATKDIVQFGGHDPIEITCEATGGGLTYNWYVDLGDLIPISEDRSVMEFTASDCCIGDKFIMCTVENTMGTVTDTLEIFIEYPEK